MPLRYAVAAFLFYLIALAWGTWSLRKTFDGLNLYLGVINGLIFTYWSVYILNRVDSMTVNGSSLALLFTGLMYFSLAAVMYVAGRQMHVSVMLYSLGGMLLSFVAASSFLDGVQYENVLQVFLWLSVSIVIFTIAKWRSSTPLVYVSQAIWFIVLVYWFATTWGSTHGDWFGIYIPFMNNGALAWLLLAALGFYFATLARGGWDHVFAVFSHIVVGGLLTVQVENIWLGESVIESISLSVTWGVYALLLFVWGAYRQELLYRVFGSMGLIFVAVKTIFFD